MIRKDIRAVDIEVVTPYVTIRGRYSKMTNVIAIEEVSGDDYFVENATRGVADGEKTYPYAEAEFIVRTQESGESNHKVGLGKAFRDIEDCCLVMPTHGEYDSYVYRIQDISVLDTIGEHEVEAEFGGDEGYAPLTADDWNEEEWVI